MGEKRTTDVRRHRRGGAALVLATLLALTASACGGDEGPAAAGETSSTVKVYMVNGEGKLTAVETKVDGAGQMRPQGKALAAVKLLVSTTATDDPLSHWGGRCAAGAKVESLAQEGDVIVVRVNGPAGVMCQRSGTALTQQRQQLAWTVVDNMQASPGTPVRLYGPNRGLMWQDVVANEDVLAR